MLSTWWFSETHFSSGKLHHAKTTCLDFSISAFTLKPGNLWCITLMNAPNDTIRSHSLESVSSSADEKAVSSGQFAIRKRLWFASRASSSAITGSTWLWAILSLVAFPNASDSYFYLHLAILPMITTVLCSLTVWWLQCLKLWVQVPDSSEPAPETRIHCICICLISLPALLRVNFWEILKISL